MPLIMLVMPILLVLEGWTVGRRATVGLASAALLYVWVRLAAAWGVRLFGGRSEDVWPLVEQGGYVLVFAAAALWTVRIPQASTDKSTTAFARM